MKKIMALFSALIFLLTATALAEPPATPTVPPQAQVENSGKAFAGMWLMSAALGDDRAWALDSEGALWVWDYQSDPEIACTLPVCEMMQGYYDLTGEALRQAEEAVFGLAAADGALYALNPYAGRIGTVDGEGVHWATDFDAGALIAPYGQTYYLADTLIHDGALYILTDRYELGVWVMRIDLATGATSLFEAPWALSMCAQGERLLLACMPFDEATMRSGEPYVLSMDPLTGESERLAAALPAGEDWQMKIAASGEAMYLLAMGNFYLSRGGDFEPLQSGPEICSGMRLLSDGRMAVRGGGITLYRMAQEPAENTLTIRGSLVDGDTRSRFIAAHPEALLQVLDHTLTPSEAADRIRTGDTDTDVFIIRVDASYGALIDKGYAAPLDDNAVLAGSAAKMYPEIRSVLTDGQGRLLAYPAEVEALGWGVNSELWRKYFGDQPLPATYLELFDDMKAFLAMDNEDGDLFFDVYNFGSMVKNVLESYLASAGDAARFDDPALLQTLTRLGEVQRTLDGMRLSGWDEMEMFYYEEVGGLHSLLGHGMSYSTSHAELGGSGEKLILTVDGTPVTLGRMYVMIVNPTSPRQALAKEFIATAAQVDKTSARYATRYAVLHTDAEPVQGTNWAGEAYWRVSAEALADWAETVKTVRFGERTLLMGDRMTEQIAALSERCAAGQLSVERMLEQLGETAGMILSEQQ